MTEEPLLCQVFFTETASSALLDIGDKKAIHRITRKVQKDIEGKSIRHLRQANLLKEFIGIPGLAELITEPFRLLGTLKSFTGVFHVVDVQRKKGNKLPKHILSCAVQNIQPYKS